MESTQLKDNVASLQTSLKENTKAMKDRVVELTAEPGKEGDFTAGFENVTSKLPSMGWLGLAAGSMLASAVLLASPKRKDLATFVGLWAPCFMLIGVYNKLVKLEGNDSTNRDERLVDELH